MECSAFLQKTVPFSDLSKILLIQTCSKLKVKRFSKNEYVFRKGDSSHKVLYIVYEGLAEVLVSADTQDIGVSFRKPHDIFGETVFLSGNTYPASVKVIMDLTCFVLDLDTFEDLCLKHPSFAKYFNEILSNRMRTLYQQLILNQSYDTPALETNPFRHSLGELMGSPVITCSLDDDAHYVAKLMNDNNISSVVVTDQQGIIKGIIAERDFVTKYMNLLPTGKPILAVDLMTKDPVQLPSDAYYFQGFLAMVKSKSKHVLISDSGKLVGIVSIRDLVKIRTMGAFSVIDEIETLKDVASLKKVIVRVDNVLRALVSEKAPPIQICELITEYYDRIIAKIIEIKCDQMVVEGYGNPPADFCWIALGSSGRKEKLLTTELHNGLVYSDLPLDEVGKAQGYFLKLGGEINLALEECGFTPSQDGVMASKSNWCKPLKQWREDIESWQKFDKASIEAITLLLDMRPIWGHTNMAEDIKDYLFATFGPSTTAHYHLAREATSLQVPVKKFKKAITEQYKVHDSEINLKNEASIQIVDCIRLLAMQKGIRETCTLKRLSQLVKKDALPKEEAEYLEAAYQSLVMFRLKANLEKAKQGKPLNNMIDANKLTMLQYSALKEAFLAASQMQDFIKQEFIEKHEK